MAPLDLEEVSGTVEDLVSRSEDLEASVILVDCKY